MLSVILTSIDHQDTVILCKILEDALELAGIPFMSSKYTDRGDSTILHLIIGKDSGSPMIEKKSADMIISADPIATKRAIDFLKPDGHIVSESQGYLSDRAIELGYSYPDEAELFETLMFFTKNIHPIAARSLATESQEKIKSHLIILGHTLSLGILPLYWEHMQESFQELGGGISVIFKERKVSKNITPKSNIRNFNLIVKKK